MASVIAPTVTPDDRYFWDGVAGGELVLRSCADCKLIQQPPTPMCPRCGSVSWLTEAACGTGTINSWIVSRHPNQAEGEARIVILVDLDEGVRLVSNLVDATASEVRAGQRVQVKVLDLDGVKLPVFQPVLDGGAK